MMTLIELAERCEKASGADRELDGAIWAATDPAGHEATCSFRGMKYAGHIHTKAEKAAHIAWASKIHAPSYTNSLDAALKLVPEGWGGAIHFSENRQHRTVKLGRPYPFNANTFSEARTDALALCAAALRARAVVAVTPEPSIETEMTR